MRFTLTIPGRLPGLNEMLAAERASFRTKKGKKISKGWLMKRDQEAIIRFFIRSSSCPKFQGPVKVICRWYEKDRRRDPDNVQAGIKFILDALVKSGKLRNDNRKTIRDTRHIMPPPDPSNPRIEVEIEEVQLCLFSGGPVDSAG